MNVLQIVPELNAGGVERTTLEIAEALTAKGHVPHVASAGGRLESELAALGGVLHKFNVGSKNPLHLRQNAKTLIDIIKAHNIDIAHARSRAPAWPGHAASKATGIKFLTTYHGIYNANTSLKRRYNAIMTKGDLVIANSEYTKAHIIEEHGTDPEKIIVIPRAVDMARFDMDTLSPTDISAQFDLWFDMGVAPLDYTIVLLPGRLTRWKGQKVAIEAIAALPPKFVLICQGDAQGRDDYVEELRRYCRELKVEDRVIFPGHNSNMPAAIAASDMVLSASTDPEAFGRVAAEAQAMMRPIIATAHGGALETVVNGKTGLLVPPGDATAMALAIAKVAEWADYDGEFARKRISGNFSKTRLQNDTLEVYRRLML